MLGGLHCFQPHWGRATVNFSRPSPRGGWALECKEHDLEKNEIKFKGSKEDTDVVNECERQSEEARYVNESEVQWQNLEEQDTNLAMTVLALF